MIPRYNQACEVLKPLTEQMDLEKYYDIYDISDIDFSEAMLGYSETEFEDLESLRVLKILAARFHTMRKVLLCCLLALDAKGGKSDFLRWSAAVGEINGVKELTKESEDRLRRILGEEESEYFAQLIEPSSNILQLFPCQLLRNYLSPRAGNDGESNYGN